MKKIILVVLILFCVSLSVFSSEEYEGWDKWDDEFPPADSENWQWALFKKAIVREYTFIGYEEYSPTIVSIGYFYYGAKPFKEKVFVLFYSPEDSENWKISDSALAIAAFPPQKNKVLVRAYQKDTEGKFKCFESWKIKIKQDEQKDIVSLKSKFSKVFREWFFDSIAKVQRKKTDMNSTISKILPRIELFGEAIQLFPKVGFMKKVS